jgi:hypothetical protein
VDSAGWVSVRTLAGSHPQIADWYLPEQVRMHFHLTTGLLGRTPGSFELRAGWSLPYSPAAGCVRGFAFHGQRIYAAAEVGGVLRSTDRGEHWEMANGNSSDWQGRINTDVHSLNYPGSPELVFTPPEAGSARGTAAKLGTATHAGAWVDG